MQTQRTSPTQPRGVRPPTKPGSWYNGRWMLVLLALVCAAPVIASYLMYYVFKPAGGTTSYGTLIDPQRPVPAQLMVVDENGHSAPLKSFEGKWLMITVNGSDCDEQCVKRLFYMRQVRVLQNGERDRVVDVWLRTDDKPVSDVIKSAYPQPDTRMFIANQQQIAAWLPVDDNSKLTDHIFLVDPNGNLMMRFPKDPDPKKINADLAKLLKWSRIG